MKQGTSSHTRAGGKSEPRPKAASLNHVTNIGLKQVYTKQPPGLYKSDGYKAPTTGKTRHPSGSQGKHK